MIKNNIKKIVEIKQPENIKQNPLEKTKKIIKEDSIEEKLKCFV
jgi:hypothetical protein